jgi:hypothetical protein
MDVANLVFTLYVILAAYGFGGGVVEGGVNYPAWRQIDPATFPAYHRAVSRRLVPLFAIPFCLSLVPQIMLLWVRPPGLPRWLVAVAIGLNLIILGSTAALQIPRHLRLMRGRDDAVLAALIRTDRWLRLLPAGLMTLANGAMLMLVL